MGSDHEGNIWIPYSEICQLLKDLFNNEPTSNKSVGCIYVKDSKCKTGQWFYIAGVQWAECWCFSKFIRWNLALQTMLLEVCLCRVLANVSVLIKEPPERHLSLLPREVSVRRCQLWGNGPSAHTESASTLVLASRTARNKFVVYKLSVYGILL
jgi:hypothetical protein